MGPGTRPDGPLPLRLLPFVAMAVISVVDFSAGPSVGYLPLLALGPAFASLFGGLWRTVSVGVLAIVLCTLLAAYSDVLGTFRTNLTFVSIGGVTAAGMIAATYRQRRERELADVRDIAEAAQRVLLRPMPRRVGPVRATVRYISAAAGARIGGDLYEVVQTSRGVRVIVGDVQGKGLDAVETAAVVLGAFREAAYDEPDLPGVADRIERALARQLTSEQFVTAVLAEVHEKDGVTLLNRGHPPPLLIRPDASVIPLDPPEPAPPLGLAVLVDDPAPTGLVGLAPGDQMLLYTDGVIEARDGDGEFYPLTERAGVLAADDPEDAIDGLQSDLLAYVGAPLDDDAAMLLLRRRI
ncbi:PP2C family protein-serine/threonine phosphatase [Actinomadura algeriensis]|uniref:Serine phosphatase RsbU (Regulator of sigma subunit) n=1 Tax=Actinomadura algeriensis TaxID=1679523 RepID=A0ABR9K2P4_9ACTN|nr:PP2C family protein-serine/threonine phosphatase [Actinomadura algeriensis]MBE1536595.1 serine phosphatase RsbU (regulator of sigma subunit) [Actinomadura algeriensis]